MRLGLATVDSTMPDQDRSTLVDLSARELVEHVGSQQHAMAGAVIALSASQACALGEACVRISYLEQPADSDGIEIAASLDDAKQRLLELANRDANAIAAFVALRDAGRMLEGQELLCELPVEVGRLAVAAAEALSAFRPLVAERVHDDMEMAIVLLHSAAKAAMLLLDSNLRIWQEAPLHVRFEPSRASLESKISRLTPVARLRA